MAIQERNQRFGPGRASVCKTLDSSVRIQALVGMLRTDRILTNHDSFASAGGSGLQLEIVNFLVHHILPVFKYLFFAGLIGAIPVIIITAIKTAQSMLEQD